MADKETIREILETAAEALSLESRPETPQRIESLAALLALNPVVRMASRRQLSEAVAQVLPESDFLPKPKAILGALASQPKPVAAPQGAHEGCTRCRGSGAIPVIRVFYPAEGLPQPLDTACRCECSAGQRFARLPTIAQLSGPNCEVHVDPTPEKRQELLGLPDNVVVFPQKTGSWQGVGLRGRAF